MEKIIEEDSIYLEKVNKRIYKQELLELLRVKENDIVYVGGSLIEGQVNPASCRVGNACSDLDLFIIRMHDEYAISDAIYEDEGKKTFFTEYRGLGCDIEIFDYEVISEVIKAIRDIQIKEDKRIFNSIKLPKGWEIRTVNGFLTRFMYGIPLLNENKFEHIKKLFDISLFQKLLKYKYTQEIDNNLEDIRGNLLQGEMETALLLCRDLSYNLINFILISEGIFNDRTKWAWIKAENLMKDNSDYQEIYGSFRKILFEDLSASMNSDIKDFLTCVENTIQNILIKVSL